MKRLIYVITMLCAILPAAFAQNTGIIRELTGEVELKHAGASAFVPAQLGGEVGQNTVISTGFKGTAIIAVGSSTITVRPLTRLTLSELQLNASAEKLDMNLQAGRVKIDVKPPEGTKASFTVQSPSATASVRGTSFEFDTQNLNVTEGTVSFKGVRGSARPVHAGYNSYLNKDGSAADQSDASRANANPPPPAGADSYGGMSAPLPTGVIGRSETIDIEVVY